MLDLAELLLIAVEGVVQKSLNESKRRETKEALAIAGSRAVKLLEDHGIRLVDSQRMDVVSRGGAGYLKYQGVVAIGKDASVQDIVHEIGHAVDACLASDTRIVDQQLTDRAYWSDRIKSTLAADAQAAKPRKPGPSWENKYQSWEYAFSSPTEAFAHIYGAIKGNDTRINDFSIKDAMPRTYAVVQEMLRKGKLLK